MIAPMQSKAGHQRFEAAWEYDQQHGTIAVRGYCDEESLQTVSQFASVEQFQDEVNKTKLNWADHDFNVIWNFHREIQVADLVIARQGRRAILGVGTVTKTAYYDFAKGVERVGAPSLLSEKLKSYITPRFIEVFWTVTGNFPVEQASSAIVDEVTESQYHSIVQKMPADQQKTIAIINEIIKNIQIPSGPDFGLEKWGAVIINEIIKNIQVPSIHETLEVGPEVSHLRHQPKLSPEKKTEPSDSPIPNYYVGIDLGTTNSVMAWGFTNPQTRQLEPKIVPIDMMVEHNAMRKMALLPSYVYFEAGQPPSVGEYAKKMLQRQPARVVKSIKTEMGNQKQFNFDNVNFTPTEISAQILKHLAASAKSHFGFIPNEVTLTVPAYFDANMRDATIKAARIAGFRNTDFLTETYAILLNRINEENSGETARLLSNSHKCQLVLIFDLGGGSLDVSLHQVYHNSQNTLYTEDIAISTYHKLGGYFFDQLLADYFLDAYVKEFSLTPDDFQKTLLVNAFREYAEQAKIELSEQIVFEKDLGLDPYTSPDTFKILPIIQKPFEDKEFYYELSLGEYEQLIAPFLAPHLTLDAVKHLDAIEFNNDNIIYPILEVLRKGEDKIGTFPQIDAVLLNGGMTKLPTIQKRLETLFECPLLIPQDPDGAVARGAVVYCHKLSWNERNKSKQDYQQSQRTYHESLEPQQTLNDTVAIKPEIEASPHLDIDSEITTLTINFEKLGRTNDLITQKVILEQIRAQESGILTAVNADKFIIPLCRIVSSLDNFGKISIINLLGNLAANCSDTTLLSNICDVALELVEFEKTKANSRTYVKSVVQSAVWTLGKIGSRERENPLPIQQLIPIVTSLMEQLKADFHDDIKRNSIYALAEICDRRKCANDVVSIRATVEVLLQLVSFLNEQNAGNSSDDVTLSKSNSKLQEVAPFAIQMIRGDDLSSDQESSLRAIREEN